MPERLAYSIQEAATVLSLSRSGVKELLYTGRLKSVPVGRRKLIPAWAIHEFLSVADVAPTTEGQDWDQMLEGIYLAPREDRSGHA